MKSNERSGGAPSHSNASEEPFAWVRVADLSAIRAEVAAIRRLLAEPSERQKTFLSEKEAQAYLGCKTTWLWEQRRCGRLPVRKVGGKLYYRREDLDALVERGSAS